MTSAVLFQNMPPLSPEEYRALEDSIREHGIQVPIVVDENRTVIDGHHRQKIAQELGIECPRRYVFDKTEAEKRTLALSLNLDRRHLNREQRRALIAESIKSDPQLSNRQHAERVGASHVTVGVVRDHLESTGQLVQSETRVSADGRERPATQPARAPKPSTGIDGKEYSRPEPRAPEEPVKPRRRPLTDAFFDATYDARKKIETLVRLTQDDRFPQNREQVASKHGNDLREIADALADVLRAIQ